MRVVDGSAGVQPTGLQGGADACLQHASLGDMKGARTTDLQIRGMPSALRDKVRARATKKGQTMSQHLIDVIQRAIDDQENAEAWLEKVRNWKPIPVKPGTDTAKAVREAREERAEQLARGAMERARSRPA